MTLFIFQVSELLIEYIPLQQGLRPLIHTFFYLSVQLIEYIPLQQGLRQKASCVLPPLATTSLSIFHYNKD